MSIMRTACTAVTLLSVLMVAGCGSESGSGKTEPSKAPQPHAGTATTPPGYSRVAAGSVSVAAPSAWTPGTVPAGWSLALEQHQGQNVLARLGVITDVPQVTDASLVSLGAFAGIQAYAAQARRGPAQKLAVPGAKSAVRVDYTYQNVPASGPKQPARGTDVSIVYGNAKAVTVRITGLQTSLTPDVISNIVQGIEVTS